MNPRFLLRSPDGPVVVRDVVDGVWAEATGSPATTVGDGLWALPGLVDAHAHVAAETVFDAGDVSSAKQRLRDALRSGLMLVVDKGWTDRTALTAAGSLPEFERPDFEAAELIISVDSGYYDGFGLVVEPADIATVAADQADKGLGWVKLVGDWPRKGKGPLPNFTDGQLKAAVQSAEASGARVAIHTMARDVPSMAVAAGIHSIEHGLFLTEADIEDLAGREGMWVPTVLRMEQVIEQIGSESSGGRLITAGLQNVSRLLPIAAEAGVHILAGTDMVGAPGDVSREAIRLAEVGLTPAQAVAAVSTSGMKATGRSTTFDLGTPANAAFFDANPVEELGVLAHPTHVLRLGHLG